MVAERMVALGATILSYNLKCLGENADDNEYGDGLKLKIHFNVNFT